MRKRDGRFGKTKNFKKIEKNFKKGVDILKEPCYYVQARSRAQKLPREHRTLKTIQNKETQRTTVNKLELIPFERMV